MSLPATPALVLLHAPYASIEVWGAVPEALRRSGYDVVVPAVAEDDAPPTAPRFVARAALQIRDALADRPVVLVAHGAAGPLLPSVGFARQAIPAPVAGYLFVDADLPRVFSPADPLQPAIPGDWPDAPVGYLRLSDAGDGAARIAQQRGWQVERLDLHHVAATTDSKTVADALLRLLPQR